MENWSSVCVWFVRTLNQNLCEHDDEDRSMEGVWTTKDLQHAVGVGYKVLEICEVWYWNEKKGRFADYITS